MKKVVISLGGNALTLGSKLHTASDQLAACYRTAQIVIDLAQQGIFISAFICIELTIISICILI
jgi:carbamate kinase